MNSCCGSGLKSACAAIASGELPQQELLDRVTRSFTLLMVICHISATAGVLPGQSFAKF
jgi:hypothetical protein